MEGRAPATTSAAAQCRRMIKAPARKAAPGGETNSAEARSGRSGDTRRFNATFALYPNPSSERDAVKE